MVSLLYRTQHLDESRILLYDASKMLHDKVNTMSGFSFSSDQNRHHELFICQFGEEMCQPTHFYGPCMRDHVLIHFVASGCGVFQCGGRSYAVTAGQGFLILPDEETFYQADKDTPWHYAWVGYRGSQAEAITQAAGLDETHRVFTAEDPQAAWQTMMMMMQDARNLRLIQMASAGNLLRFLSIIAPAQDPIAASPARQYCDKARWYLEGRYDRDVSIQETADFVGLSRSHLYRLMMEAYGCSPKELLLQIRMRHAEQLLADTRLTLEEIAHRVGLQTGAQLGAAFRATHGVSPGKYRKESEKR